MAKDGTMRGGPRVAQTGRPRKSPIEKLENNNPGKRKITALEVPENFETVDLEGVDMPPVKDYLSAEQRDGTKLYAPELYKKTWLWLQSLGVEKLVNVQLIEQYAMSVSRWIQCEEAITKYGFLGKHPTSQAPIQSPYVSMSQTFMKQANMAWVQIYQIVKENCQVDFKGPNPQEDAMEMLLRKRSVKKEK